MRKYKGAMAHVVSGVAIVAMLYHCFFISGIADWMGIHLFLLPYRAGSLALIILLTFLLYPATKKSAKDRLCWSDILFLIIGVTPCIYMLLFAEQLIENHTRFVYLPALIAFFPLFIALLEATRRTTGIVIVMIAVAFFLYPLFQSYIPGILGGKSFALASFCSYLYINIEVGTFGVAYGAASSIIVVYILLSQFLLVSGAGNFFLNLALSIMGHVRGGPAKVSVVASSFFGTLSGSVAANVAATGSITIPMMKSSGYKPSFAGAVEAVASNGGQLVPPVMGMVIFVMADLTGIPYWKLCVVSILPAILYYVALFIQIDMEAARTGLTGLSREQVPSFRQTMKTGWVYLVPMVGLLAILIVLKYTPQMAGLYAIIILFVVTLFSKEGRLGPRNIIHSLESGAQSFVMPAIVCALVGVIIGSVIQTGLGIKLSSILVKVSGGSILVLLVLTGFSCYILGMGLGSIPLYIMMVVLTAPALLKMGVDIIPAHLFVLWFGLTSFITPPVCIAIYVACAISGSKTWETGGTAMRLGIGTYLVPFAFVYRPTLLMQGRPGETVIAALASLIGISAIALGASRHFLKPLNLSEMVFLLGGGVLLLAPTISMNSIGLALLILVVVKQLRSQLRAKP